MTDAERIKNMEGRIAQLEKACREVWGVLLLASTTDKPAELDAAFRKADRICRRTGLMAKEGMQFVYREEG